MPRDAITWPMYFAKRPLQARRVTLRAGDPFPIQDKAYIRGLAAAYGMKDPDRLRFADLDYVDVLDVHSEEQARHIADRGLPLKDARRLVGQKDAA